MLSELKLIGVGFLKASFRVGINFKRVFPHPLPDNKSGELIVIPGGV